MNKAADETSAPCYDAYPFDTGAIVRLALIGALSGVLGWLLYLGIAHYFIDPVFCQRASTFAVCRNGGTIAWIAAQVVVLAAAVAVLARFAVYRPLLVALGVLAALWSAHAWLGGMAWYMGLVWHGLLFALAFAIFGWVARVANFVLALVLMLILVIVSRVVLMFS